MDFDVAVLAGRETGRVGVCHGGNPWARNVLGHALSTGPIRDNATAVFLQDQASRAGRPRPGYPVSQIGGGVPPAGVFAVEQRREPAVVDQHVGQMQVQMSERGLYQPVNLGGCLFQHQAGGGDLPSGQQPRCGVAGCELGGSGGDDLGPRRAGVTGEAH